MEPFLQQFVDRTELYSTQKNPNWLFLSSIVELYKFFGIHLYMSLIKQNSSKRYWCFSLNRFEDIKRFLHFNDNAKITKKTDKIQPFFDQVLSVTKNTPIEESLYVDKLIITVIAKQSIYKKVHF